MDQNSRNPNRSYENRDGLRRACFDGSWARRLVRSSARDILIPTPAEGRREESEVSEWIAEEGRVERGLSSWNPVAGLSHGTRFAGGGVSSLNPPTLVATPWWSRGPGWRQRCGWQTAAGGRRSAKSRVSGCRRRISGDARVMSGRSEGSMAYGATVIEAVLNHHPDTISSLPAYRTSSAPSSALPRFRSRRMLEIKIIDLYV